MTSSERYLGLIPARGGSKGIPRKNLAPLGGRPLLAWTVEAAVKSRRLDRVLFTSEDDELLAAARAAGGDAPFRRPAELASDSASQVDVALHALDWLAEHRSAFPKTLVLLQPTSPFRDATDIDSAIARFEQLGAKSLMSVTSLVQHPCEMVREEGGSLRFAVDPPVAGRGRQSFPSFHFIDGSIYIVDVAWFREHKKFLAPDTRLYEIPASHGIDIDDPFQLALARGLVAVKEV